MASGGFVATSFTAKYDGGAVESGEMDVRELAPALLSFADALAAVNRVANPHSPEAPRVSVVGSPERGSFIIDLAVQEPSLIDKAVSLFSGDGVNATVNAVGLVSIMIGGVEYLRRGIRKARRGDPESPGGLVPITFANGDTAMVEPTVLRIVDDDDYRRAIRSITRPLDGQAADILSITSGDNAPVVVTSSETDEFLLPFDEAVVAQSEMDLVLSIVTAVFQPGRKWQLSDGQQKAYYTMADFTFESQVDEGNVALRASDRLHCRVRITQRDSGGNLRTDRTILKVTRHVPGDHEPTLDTLMPSTDDA